MKLFVDICKLSEDDGSIHSIRVKYRILMKSDVTK